jgi:uncharacterized Rossmann fold enzyme
VNLPQHPGARICVMGGGPGLADDVARVRADVWISANHHGARVRAVDYVVALDDEHSRLHRPMHGLIREYTTAPIIAPHAWADILLAGWPLQLLYTGPVACWVAAQMHPAQIVLAGFDCYGGKASAMTMHRKYLPHVPGDVRVVSGPLLELYPAFEPQEATA